MAQMFSLGDKALVGELNYTTLNPPVSGVSLDILPITLDKINNRVGINTTTPNHKLDVRGAVNTIVAEFGDGTRTLGISPFNTTDNGIAIRNGTENRIGLGSTSGSVVVGRNYIGVFAGTLEGLIIEGNVGVGITAPSSKLDVAGTGNFTGQLTVNLPMSFATTTLGTVGAPTILQPIAPSAGITTFTLGANKSSLVIFCRPAPTATSYSTFEVITPFTNVLLNYTINVSMCTANASGVIEAIPLTSITTAFSTKTPANTAYFQVVLAHDGGYVYSTQSNRIVIDFKFSG